MEELSLKIGEKLKRIRTARQMTLEKAAEITTISKPMLGQIERGQSIPTVTTLWKIATGFKVPLSFFLEEPRNQYTTVRPEKGKVLIEEEGRMRAYPLFPYDPLRNTESFYIEFDGGCCHPSEKHVEGTEEMILVIRGSLQIDMGETEVTVEENQALRFRADMPHWYRNSAERECAVYNIIFYPKE